MLHEMLKLKEIYTAEPTIIDRSNTDRHGNPWVDIIKDGMPGYYGRVLISTQKGEFKKKLSNGLRGRLAVGDLSIEDLTILVVGIRQDQLPEGPYGVIATLDMVADRAFGVLKGKNVFYARHMFDSKKGGDPILRVYNGKGELACAFLVPIGLRHKGDARRIYCECDITENKLEKTELGDYFIVRLQNVSAKSGTMFCVRLVNFLPTDDARAPDGRRLLTRVSAYSAGGSVFDVPLLSVEDAVGVGYVPSLGSDKPYYTPVRVEGAARDLGRYVSEAVIVKDLGDVLVCEKVK